jgi:histidine triad (HIT) family protein
MDNCIFCKIVKGEIPSYKIYEDENFLAFLNIYPATEGYTLVIPKQHFRWVWDLNNIGEYFEVCQKVAKHFQKVSGNEGVYSMILGEEVPHAHVHIIPDADNEYIKQIHKFNEDLKEKGVIKKLEGDAAEEVLKKYRLID